MTDQQTHTDTWGMDLIVHRHYALPDQMVITTVTAADDHRARYSVAVPTARLLAMIDAVDPDAMRAYLRETAPEVIADLYRPAPAAADHFDYLDAVPEADSPEDIDAHPEPVITVTPEALDAAEQLGRNVAAILDAFARGIAR